MAHSGDGSGCSVIQGPRCNFYYVDNGSIFFLKIKERRNQDSLVGMQAVDVCICPRVDNYNRKTIKATLN